MQIVYGASATAPVDRCKSPGDKNVDMFCIQCCFANPNRSGPKGLFCQFSGKQAQLLQARSPFSVLMSVFAEVCSNQTTRPNHPPTTYQTRSRSWFKRRAAMCRMKLFPEQSLGLGVKARRRAYFKQEGAISRAQHRHETLGTARGLCNRQKDLIKKRKLLKGTKAGWEAVSIFTEGRL